MFISLPQTASVLAEVAICWEIFYFTQNSVPLNYGMPTVLLGGQESIVGIAACCWLDIQASNPGACEGFSLCIHPDKP